MGEFPASRGRETGCRFAGFYVQPFRTTVIVRDAFAGWTDFPRRAGMKRTAASRGLRPSIPDNGDCLRCFRGMDGFPAPCGRETDCRFAGFTFKHSGQRRLSAVLSRMDGFPASRGRETGCRFAVGYVQAFRTTAVSRDGRIFFSARALRSSIPDNDPSSAKRPYCPANLPQEVRGRFSYL